MRILSSSQPVEIPRLRGLAGFKYDGTGASDRNLTEMRAMTVMIPEKDELRSRILEHLQARPDNPMVSAVWYGYLAGLSEWGVLELKDHAELVKLLPGHGKEETNEVTLGPDYMDRIPELRQ